MWWIGCSTGIRLTSCGRSSTARLSGHPTVLKLHGVNAVASKAASVSAVFVNVVGLRDQTQPCNAVKITRRRNAVKILFLKEIGSVSVKRERSFTQRYA